MGFLESTKDQLDEKDENEKDVKLNETLIRKIFLVVSAQQFLNLILVTLFGECNILKKFCSRNVFVAIPLVIIPICIISAYFFYYKCWTHLKPGNRTNGKILVFLSICKSIPVAVVFGAFVDSEIHFPFLISNQLTILIFIILALLNYRKIQFLVKLGFIIFYYSFAILLIQLVYKYSPLTNPLTYILIIDALFTLFVFIDTYLVVIANDESDDYIYCSLTLFLHVCFLYFVIYFKLIIIRVVYHFYSFMYLNVTKK